MTLLFFPLQSWSEKTPPVPQHYAHWLNEEVNYLITKEERTEFLRLTSDQARDQFIDSFWMARNPAPGAPTNVFKEEHYKRLAYANQHFGSLSFGDGEASDRGMTYITLGEPAQIQNYHEAKHLRPIEIWFFQNTSGALPIHFYVLFYKPSPSEDYRLYSPTIDKPQKLINGSDAVNNDALAIKIINDDLGVEVAHVALSLIPGEPVDFKAPAPTMQSDVLLGQIRNYWNLPTNKDLLALRRGQLSGVSHRVILGEQFSDLTVTVSRDEAQQVSAHYLFRLHNPQDLGLAEQTDGRFYYSFSIEAQLLDADGKEIYKDTHPVADYLTRKQFDTIRQSAFGVEGRLPIAPGKYTFRLAVTNVASKQVFRQSHLILVPAFDHPLGISPVFFAGTNPPRSDPSKELPFSYSSIKLSPIGSENAQVAQGDPLRVIFQLWEAPSTPASLSGKTLDISYLIGQLGSQEKQEEHQTVDRGNFDPSGDLLIGKDFRTDTIQPGNHRLVIKVTNPDDHTTVYQSLNFEVKAGSATVSPLWIVTVPPSKESMGPGIDLYRSGLCALSNHDPDAAINYFKRAIALHDPNPKIYQALQDTYKKQGNTKAADDIERQSKSISKN